MLLNNQKQPQHATVSVLPKCVNGCYSQIRLTISYISID